MAENTQNSNNYYILWDRYAKVTFKVKNGSETEEIEFERFRVENVVDSSPDFEIETEFDITESTNIAKIVIYNLTDEIIKKLKKGVEVIIEAGYWNDGKNKDIGVIYKGIIESLKGSWSNADKKFEITCNTYNDEYKDTKINLKAEKGTKASTIIKLILSKLDKLKAGTIELGKDIDYKDGKTLHNNVKYIFKELAKDTKSVFFITNGVVTFQPRDKINRGLLEFDPNRFQDVKENDGTYTLKAIFDHRFQEGFKINLDLKKAFEQLEIKGEYLITKGKHVMNFKTDAYTELEIKTKFDDEETKKANEIEIVTGKKGKNEKSSKKKKGKEKSKKDGKDKKSKEKESRKDSKKETKKGGKKTTTKSNGKKKEKDWDRIVRTYGVGGNK
nr:MAG TPA: tail protein [Caudoviricetes sp.]